MSRPIFSTFNFDPRWDRMYERIWRDIQLVKRDGETIEDSQLRALQNAARDLQIALGEVPVKRLKAGCY